MKRLPKRIFPYKKFKFNKSKLTPDSKSSNFVGIIKIHKTIRIFYHNFETLRLQLTWSLVRRRRLTKKMFFKQKMSKKKKKKLFFKWPYRYNKFQRSVWYIGFPHLPYTTKPKGSRMGKGKGGSKNYFYKCYAGQTLIYISNYSKIQLYYTFYKVHKCIPSTTFYIYNNYRTSNLKWD